MGTGRRDREFAKFVAGESNTLLHCAYLCHGDATAARDVVELAVARAYAAWGRSAIPRLDALRVVTRPQAARPFLPWRSPRRLTLVDVTPSRSTPPPMLVRALGVLPHEQRRALVLSLVGGLNLSQLSIVVAAGEIEAQRRLHLAEEHLDSRHTDYGATDTLTEALLQAVPSSLGERGTTHGSDRTHGRFLIRARRRRVVALAAAAMAAVVLVVQGVGVFRSQDDFSNQRPLPEASIAPSSISTGPPLPTAAQATCQTNYPPCQYQIIELWRLQMRDIIAEYLDPDGRYFASDFVRVEDPDMTLYDGNGGVLAVGVTGDSGSGTQLRLEIATSAEYATPCGDQTGQSCVSQQFLDGNRFLVTGSSSAAQGVEVQYAPYDEVITLTGRESGKGKTLTIDRGQLVKLIKDPRLRLPTI